MVHTHTHAHVRMFAIGRYEHSRDNRYFRGALEELFSRRDINQVFADKFGLGFPLKKKRKRKVHHSYGTAV